MSNTRLYRVLSTSSDKQRLVEATSPHAARSFVARKEYSVDIPAQHEIFAMAKAGVEIEVAGADPVSDETRTAVAQNQIPV